MFKFNERELSLLKSALKKDIFDYAVKESQHNQKYDDRLARHYHIVKQEVKTLLKKLEND